jgi:hypothetical protein
VCERRANAAEVSSAQLSRSYLSPPNIAHYNSVVCAWSNTDGEHIICIECEAITNEFPLSLSFLMEEEKKKARGGR